MQQWMMSKKTGLRRRYKRKKYWRKAKKGQGRKTHDSYANEENECDE